MGKSLFLSLEMTEEQVGIKLMSIATGIPTAKLENQNIPTKKRKLESAEKLRKYKYSIVDFTNGVNVLEFGIILNKYKFGYNVAYVDYIQLIKWRITVTLKLLESLEVYTKTFGKSVRESMQKGIWL